MKRFITIIMVATLLVPVLALTGCNKQIIDTTFKYERAIISLPDGSIVEGEIDSWTDYDDGDQIQVKINGITYLVHSEDVVLIAE